MSEAVEAGRSQSVTEIDDSDNEQQPGEQNGKPGRKKNASSAAARRDQNRIAQREFRLRKQQRIKELETRVEILSGSRDEALGAMKDMMRELMAENQALRNLLRGLSSFIGDGAGGLLPKLGWDMADFNNFISKGESDTAVEAFQKRKAQMQSSGNGSAHKRGSSSHTLDEATAAHKKARTDSTSSATGGVGGGNGGYSLLSLNNTQSSPSAGFYNSPPASRPSQDNSNTLSDLLRGTGAPQPGAPAPGSSIYMPPATNAPSANGHNQFNLPPPSTMGNYPPYLPPMQIPDGSTPPGLPFPAVTTPTNSSAVVARPGSQATTPSDYERDDDPKKNETYKLIHYHLDNYKRNTAYCLPASLRPTLVQRTVPHESVIDRVLHPDLRDRMILLRGRFDLVDCMIDYRNEITIHGDDVLAHHNWEISEKWLRKYGFLVDQGTLNIVNRWRKEADPPKPELKMTDLAPGDPNAIPT